MTTISNLSIATTYQQQQQQKTNPKSISKIHRKFRSPPPYFFFLFLNLFCVYFGLIFSKKDGLYFFENKQTKQKKDKRQRWTEPSPFRDQTAPRHANSHSHEREGGGTVTKDGCKTTPQTQRKEKKRKRKKPTGVEKVARFKTFLSPIQKKNNVKLVTHTRERRWEVFGFQVHRELGSCVAVLQWNCGELCATICVTSARISHPPRWKTIHPPPQKVMCISFYCRPSGILRHCVAYSRVT